MAEGQGWHENQNPETGIAQRHHDVQVQGKNKELLGEPIKPQSEEIHNKIESFARQYFSGNYITKENTSERGRKLRYAAYMKSGRLVGGLSQESYDANKDAVDTIMARAKAEVQEREAKESWVVKTLAGSIITQLSKGEDFSLYGLTAELPKDVWNQIKQYTEYIRSEDVGTDIDMYDDFKGGWTVAPKAEEVLKAIAERVATSEQREIAKRILTEREVASKEAEIKRQKKKEKQALVDEIIATFQPEASEYPDGNFRLDGERIEDPFYPQDIYGGGRWFVIQPEWIWYVRNNGHDGDDWGRNNVQTGGAGAIGVRIKYNKELAAKIRKLVS